MPELLAILCAGSLQAFDDANFRLTILIEMQWDEGDMYRTILVRGRLI